MVRSKPSGGSSAISSLSSNAKGWVSSPGMGQELASKRTEGDRRTGFEKNRGVRHLSYSELLERRSKWLCFCCGEKVSPAHRCSGQLRLIVLGDDEVVDERGEIVARGRRS